MAYNCEGFTKINLRLYLVTIQWFLHPLQIAVMLFTLFSTVALILLIFILSDNLGQNAERGITLFCIELLYFPALSALIKMQLEFARGKIVLFMWLFEGGHIYYS